MEETTIPKEMTIIRSATMVDAKVETENAVYDIRYQYDEVDGEKNLQAIHVEIYDNQSTEESKSLVNVGNMDYNSGKISMSGFPYSDKTATYMEEFSAIIEEIKGLIN